MGGEYSAKETKEALSALFELGPFLYHRVKDGVDFSDAAAVWGKLEDDAFKDKLKAAIDGAKLVPKELGELDQADVLDLAAFMVGELPKLLDALKGEAA